MPKPIYTEALGELVNFEDMSSDEIFNNLVQMEQQGNFRGIVAFGAYFLEKGALDFADTDNARTAFERWEQTLVYSIGVDTKNYKVRENKKESYDNFYREYGRFRAEWQIECGKEKEAFLERMKKGEIPDTEAIEGNEEALRGVASGYINVTGDAPRKLLFTTLSSYEISSALDLEESRYLNSLVDEGAKDVFNKLNEKDKELYKFGDVTGGSNDAGRYGYFVPNEHAGKDDTPYFTLSEDIKEINLYKRNQIDINQGREKLKIIRQEAIDQCKIISEVRTLAKDIAYEARKKLEALEKMTEKGHRNTESYDRMHNVLKVVSKFDETTSMSEVAVQLRGLKEAADNYKRQHDRFFRRRWGFGNDRFNFSKELPGFVDGFLTEYNEIIKDYKNLKKEDAKNSSYLLESKRNLIERIDNVIGDQVKEKVSVKDIDNDCVMRNNDKVIASVKSKEKNEPEKGMGS